MKITFSSFCYVLSPPSAPSLSPLSSQGSPARITSLAGLSDSDDPDEELARPLPFCQDSRSDGAPYWRRTQAASPPDEVGSRLFAGAARKVS